MPNVDPFRQALQDQLRDAERIGHAFLEINAGELHRELGPDHPMPACCQAMMAEQDEDDEIVSGAPDEASLTIRYRLPRQG